LCEFIYIFTKKKIATHRIWKRYFHFVNEIILNKWLAMQILLVAIYSFFCLYIFIKPRTKKEYIYFTVSVNSVNVYIIVYCSVCLLKLILLLQHILKVGKYIPDWNPNWGNIFRSKIILQMLIFNKKLLNCLWI